MASDLLEEGTVANAGGGGGGSGGGIGGVSNAIQDGQPSRNESTTRTKPSADEQALGDQHYPLSGVVLCCTAIPTETRSALAETAAPLGATHALDLTAAVTHLLVGHWDTPKYAFVARARPDVRVLQPSFIDAVREQWMAGADDVDVPALEKAHACPPLQGTLVCVTGLGDAEERRAIEARVHAAGGNYTGDLTRDVTHLIAAKPEGAKYIHARQWKVRVTVLQWLWDSLERGMVLDSSYYDPLLPEAEIGKGACLMPTQVQAKPVKRKGNDDPAPARKLRRTASAKFSSQNENIWGDIVGGGLTNLKPEKRDAWDENRVGESFRSDGSRATMPRRTVSEGSIQSEQHIGRSETMAQRSGGLFSGTSVFVHGFGEREATVLERHLRTHAATLYGDATEFAQAYSASPDNVAASDHLPFLVLIPHTLHPPALPSPIERLSPPPPLATDFYFEAALHARRRLPTGTTPLHLPLPGALPGFAPLTLCATGFADAELLHLAKAISRFGATYSGTLRRDASALICREPEGTATEQGRLLREVEQRDKVKFARTHGVPVLRAGWLWQCAQQGRKVSWDGWEMDGGSQRARAARATEQMPDAAPETVERPSKPTVPPLKAKTNTRNAITTEAAVATGGIAIANTTPTSPLKPRDAPAAAVAKETPLAAALSTLLAARSRSTTHSFSADPSASAGTSLAGRDDEGSATVTGATRRRRTLLGRAPSSASLRSVGSANTDGVGTPVEGAFGAGGVDGGNGDSAATPGLDDGDGTMPGAAASDHNGSNNKDAAMDVEDNPPQLTQVGYADVPAKEWRRQMDARMGGAASEVGEDDAADESLDDGAGGRAAGGLGANNRRASRRIRDEVPAALPDADAQGHGPDTPGREARRVLRRRG